MFRNNDTVVVNTFVIQGRVVGGTFVDGSPNYLVVYVGEDGLTHQKYYPEDALTANPTLPAAPAPVSTPETPAV